MQFKPHSDKCSKENQPHGGGGGGGGGKLSSKGRSAKKKYSQLEIRNSIDLMHELSVRAVAGNQAALPEAGKVWYRLGGNSDQSYSSSSAIAPHSRDHVFDFDRPDFLGYGPPSGADPHEIRLNFTTTTTTTATKESQPLKSLKTDAKMVADQSVNLNRVSGQTLSTKRKLSH